MVELAYYDRLLEFQHGRCAICDRLPGKSRLHRDHDHETGELRGLLCFRCNRYVVGRHRGANGATLLVAAGEYLSHTPAQQAGIDVNLGPGRLNKKRRRKR